ncbi:hypothetical protein RAJCM14343_1544 [Rhodococcus aetherivorans]|uniref:Uncharacterized protein n=1 Tax=Rhodococcus aetherivorans TaxID=191292 RepID=A0ABQ0YIG3_9NOCA|nr:hypothetical protein RAJCM14343_1544 [Rhodococcus aetherivorans]
MRNCTDARSRRSSVGSGIAAFPVVFVFLVGFFLGVVPVVAGTLAVRMASG